MSQIYINDNVNNNLVKENNNGKNFNSGNVTNSKPVALPLIINNFGNNNDNNNVSNSNDDVNGNLLNGNNNDDNQQSGNLQWRNARNMCWPFL